MQPKSLKVLFTNQAKTVEAAIADLASRFLRVTKTGCRVVTQSTEHPLLNFCTALVDDWQSGKQVYQPGNLTLVFSSGEVEDEADLLIYKPNQGDRFLYTRRIRLTDTSSRPRVDHPVDHPTEQLHLPVDDALPSDPLLKPQVRQPLNDPIYQIETIRETLTQLTENQRAIESRLQKLLDTAAGISSIRTDSTGSTGVSLQQLQAALAEHSASFAKILASQLASTALHFSDRLDTVQAQLNQLAEQLADDLPPPQLESEWQTRIQDTWGTVGDYEQYSASHREANAETPLFHTPDWVALCELDWARKLHPALALLHTLIHGEDGIGYVGADVLQQFGRHVDSHTGDRYYIYKLGGFSAYDALWQTANHPESAWLPILQRLCKKTIRFHEVFQLFGWEGEAIASLESVVERTRRDQRTGQQSAHNTPPQQSPPRNTIADHLAILNIGPFSPISLEFIKRAYRQAMKTAHPDIGGSKEHAQRVNAAYEAVLRHYFPNAL